MAMNEEPAAKDEDIIPMGWPAALANMTAMVCGTVIIVLFMLLMWGVLHG